jgi:hypothetical protein
LEITSARLRGSAAKRIATASGALFAIAIAAAPQQAVAGDIDCPTASEQGQKLRDQGKIIKARDMFLLCSRPTCPSVVRKDCAKWLPEVEEAVPTVVVAAHDYQGGDLATVTVTVDDQPFASTLDGKALPIDPGPHTFKYETQGSPAVTQTVIVRSGEKNRIIKVDFPPPPGKAKKPDEKKPDDRPPPPKDNSPPIGAYALGGVGVIALGSFAFFGITGKNDLNNLKSTCAPYCQSSALDDAKTKLLVADISLGVGVLALGGATVLFLTHGSGESKKETAVRVAPTPGGGAGALVTGTF